MNTKDQQRRALDAWYAEQCDLLGRIWKVGGRYYRLQLAILDAQYAERRQAIADDDETVTEEG